MPSCPHCGERIQGDFITAQAAHDISTQRDLLRVQKRELGGKVERQAAWIERLERNMGQARKEIRRLRERLEEETGKGQFEGHRV
jgi:hypothetical protein